MQTVVVHGEVVVVVVVEQEQEPRLDTGIVQPLVRSVMSYTRSNRCPIASIMDACP